MSNNISLLDSNNTDLQAILATINALPEAGSGGVELPELTTPAVASEVFSGKEYIDETGVKQTGTFTIDEELNTQTDLIAQLKTAANELPDAGSGGGDTGGEILETYTGIFVADGRFSEASIMYTDENLTLQNCGMLGSTEQISVLKNTIIFIDALGGVSVNSGCVDLGYGCAFKVTANNFSITVY